MSNERRIGVIGAGTMGAGIAQAAAMAGFLVESLDADAGLVKSMHEAIGRRLDDKVARGKLSSTEREGVMSRLRVAPDLKSMADAECVIEAVPEVLELKRKIFAELDQHATERTLLATNTSSLSIGKIADGLKHADRFLGMHFFNPAPVMKLIELVRGPATGDQALVDARAVCTKLSKTAVLVKDSPGFIGNRVNRPFYLEALLLLETGEADVPTIDAALRNVGGFKMGPFELLDLIGLDINLRVTETVYEDFQRPARFKPSTIQQTLVKDGHLGRKTGRGFYDYSGDTPVPAYETRLKDVSAWGPSPALCDFARGIGKPADRAAWLYARIYMAVMNEGGETAATIALPRDVDLAMHLGFNYPEGPLGQADFIGLDIIQRLLADLYEESGHDERYRPNALLDKRVADRNLGEKTSRGFLYHAL